MSKSKPQIVSATLTSLIPHSVHSFLFMMLAPLQLLAVLALLAPLALLTLLAPLALLVAKHC